VQGSTYYNILEDPAVSKWINRFVSPATRKTYLHRLSQFFKYLNEEKKLNVTPMQAVKENFEFVKNAEDPFQMGKYTDLLNEFLNSKLLRGKSNSYKASYARAISSFFKKNNSTLIGEINIPLRDMPYPKLYLKLEDLKTVLKEFKEPSKTCILCLLYTGMRVEEFLSLTKARLQLTPAPDTILIPLRKTGKLGRARITGETYTFLGGVAYEKLKMHLTDKTEDEPIFPIKVRTLQYNFVKAAMNAGLLTITEKRTPSGRKVWSVLYNGNQVFTDAHPFHPHALRSLFKTEASHLGIPEEISEFWMGHAGGIRRVYDARDVTHIEDFIIHYRKLTNHFDGVLKEVV